LLPTVWPIGAKARADSEFLPSSDLDSVNPICDPVAVLFERWIEVS